MARRRRPLRIPPPRMALGGSVAAMRHAAGSSATRQCSATTTKRHLDEACRLGVVVKGQRACSLETAAAAPGIGVGSNLEFYEGTMDLDMINRSYMVLLRKKDNNNSPDSFRPISLLNHLVKRITKDLIQLARLERKKKGIILKLDFSKALILSPGILCSISLSFENLIINGLIG